MEKGPDLEIGTDEKGKDKDTKTKGKRTGYINRTLLYAESISA